MNLTNDLNRALEAEAKRSLVARQAAKIERLQAERDKYKRASSVLCAKHIGVPTVVCPLCENERLREELGSRSKAARHVACMLGGAGNKSSVFEFVCREYPWIDPSREAAETKEASDDAD